MTEDARATFEEVWPGVARRLTARLVKRNVPGSHVDDVVQETGLRLLEMWDRVDPGRPVWPLAVAIAGNLLWDDVNRNRRHEVLEDVDQVAPDDVEEAAIARSELTSVSRAMRRLTHLQRAALLAEVGASDVAATVSPDALKMLRMRARRRLASLGHRFPAPAALWMRGRAVAGDFVRLPEAPAALAGLALCAVILLSASPYEREAAPQRPRTPREDGSVMPVVRQRMAAAHVRPGGASGAPGARGRDAVAIPERQGARPSPRALPPKDPPLAPRGAYSVGRLGRTGPVSGGYSVGFSPRRDRGTATGCKLPRGGSKKVSCEANAKRARVRAEVVIHRD